MDDLEKAILYMYDAGGAVDPVVKSQAIAYCQRMKEAPSICRLCVERLPRTPLAPVQFWCLQTIEECVRLRYAAMDPAERALLREFLQSAASGAGAAAACICGGPPFIKNKFVQAFVALLSLEYPSPWVSPFLDLVAALGKGDPVIDVFTRVLVSLDDEVISMEYPRSAGEIALAGRIKDAMRVQCVPQIVQAWYEIVSVYRSTEPELAAMVLDAMRRYITWIDIGLIANEVFVTLLFDLVMGEGLLEQLRGAAAGCLRSIVSKRMEPRHKLTLLQSLHVSRVFGLVMKDGESELVSKLADLIIAFATEALDCSKALGPGNATENVAMDLLEEALPLVFYVLQNCEVDSSSNAVQFLSDYVSTMKPPSEKQIHHVGQILDVIRGQIAYDPEYRSNLDLPDKIGKDVEDEMAEQRRDFFMLFRSVCRVAPDATLLFIRNLLAKELANPEMKVEEIEVTLSLLYRLGETLSDEGVRKGSGHLKEMIPMLLSTHFSCHSHRIVALTYMETVTRYLKFVQENSQYIPLLLSAFLDDRGIHHQNPNVSRRASYLFMRAVKLLKGQLIPYIEMILQSLQDTLAKFTTLDWSMKDPKTGSEDGSHTFEAIGLLIGMEDVSPEKQSDYLSALLTSLCSQVELLLMDANRVHLEEYSSKIVSIQQIIMAINALSKGFSERLVTASRPAIGAMFKKTLDVLLQILVVFPKVEPLRCKVTSFLHRMVEILGVAVFPYLPMALEKLLAKSEPKEMVAFLVLVNQLICKFNSSVNNIVEEIFPAIASRIFHVLPKDPFVSGPGGSTEELREMQELQRTLYTFLHGLVSHSLSSVLLAPNCRVYLDIVMQFLLVGSCTHRDVLVRKTSVQIVTRLIKDWGCKYNGVEKVPGFRSFIIETFATNCCLFSVLESSFNFRDANTLLLFGEIVQAKKVMYEKYGEDFLHQFVSKGLLAAHCPQHLAEQYYQKLQGDDIKAFRSFYQSVIEKLRQQQNGTLVFR